MHEDSDTRSSFPSSFKQKSELEHGVGFDDYDSRDLSIPSSQPGMCVRRSFLSYCIAFVLNSLKEKMVEVSVRLTFYYLRCITAKKKDDKTTIQSPSNEYLFPSGETGSSA